MATEKRSDAVLREAHLAAERAMATGARSVSGDPALQIAFRNESASSRAARRGEVDSYALIRRFHSRKYIAK